MPKYQLPLLVGILLLALGSHAQTGTSQSRFTIHTPEGPVSVLEFREHNAGTIGDTIFLEESNRFSIGFLKSDNSFGIVLSAKPIDLVRKDAEDRFLRDLGISEKDACKLKVIVRVPASIGVNGADRNIGLSFCPSSTPRP
jgi:hypothetical protein